MNQGNTEPQPDILQDVENVGRIDSVPVILQVLNHQTGMRFSVVARVTPERWVACAVEDGLEFGLEPGSELEIKKTFCDTVRESRDIVVMDDANTDEVYCGHPIPQQYGFRSYISVPIYTRTGDFFGTLCSLDPEPARVTDPQVIRVFKLYAELIGLHLTLQRDLTIAENALSTAHADADIRDQFIAVLGHDLRNPLAAISGSAAALERTSNDDRQLRFVKLIRSSASRMSGLVDNILDFARGQLGSGIPVDRNHCTSLPDMLTQVIDELQEAHTNSTIEVDFNVGRPVYCDPVRIAQLFSNLLANAISHGDGDRPIHVKASIERGQFELAITNHGEPIPPDIGSTIFRPFGRRSARPGSQGLGLGLFIASQIAQSHEGSLSYQSNEARTRFTFRMPTEPQGK